jgi:hypothetical protein
VRKARRELNKERSSTRSKGREALNKSTRQLKRSTFKEVFMSDLTGKFKEEAKPFTDLA